MGVKMQIIGSALQLEREQQTHEAKVVVSVQVTYKDVVNLVVGQIKSHQLHLRSFATVNKKMSVLNSKELRRRKSIVRRKRSAGSQNGY